MLLVVDGSFLSHRAKFVAEKNEDLNPRFISYLFIRSLLVSCELFSPTRVYVCWDHKKPKHRIELYEKYKANRVRDPDDPAFLAMFESDQFLRQELPKLGIISVEAEYTEADDLAYYLSHTYPAGVLLSDDKDWLLNLRKGWKVHRPRANETITFESFCEDMDNYKTPHITYLVIKALTGDNSDNIPGVRGVGLAYAKQFAPLIMTRQNLGEGALAQKVRKKMDLVRRNVSLMDPSWIMNSVEARQSVITAENEVDAYPGLKNWELFVGENFPTKYSNLYNWGKRYLKVVGKFS